MKKYILLFLILFSSNIVTAQQKGDSLAILYKRVYVYKSPADLSTRIDMVFSYNSKSKFYYLATAAEHPKFYKIKIFNGEVAFVPKNKVSIDQNLSHKQIRSDVKNGIRSKSPTFDIDPFNNFNILVWYRYIGAGLVLILLYLLWKKFIIIDLWFCRRSKKRVSPLYSKWFIKYSLITGAIIGSMQLIASNEYFWFMEDGFQLWGSYPSNWDWIIWANYVAFLLISIKAIIQAFVRFSFKVGLNYAFLSLMLIMIYFSFGIILGAIMFALFMLYAMGGQGGSNPKPSGGDQGCSTGTVKRSTDGRQIRKNVNGSWDYY